MWRSKVSLRVIAQELSTSFLEIVFLIMLAVVIRLTSWLAPEILLSPPAQCCMTRICHHMCLFMYTPGVKSRSYICTMRTLLTVESSPRVLNTIYFCVPETARVSQG